ncbi:MAG TPA: YeeE/YedE thiosulfate transporter family protein [Methylophilaceae bacterium]|nr:YeeE/YedE thiosulfate transporter family protein [Methylophilaceae bacterium]
MKKNLNHFSALIFALLSGLIFGIGLILAGMANPVKVLAFLDLAGLWDPSLGLVMGGAIAVGLVAFTLAKKRTRSFLGLPMNLPTSRIIDQRLIVGSLIFGIGWGLAGICPAPAFVLLGAGSLKGIVFLIAMLIGMGIFEYIENSNK